MFNLAKASFFALLLAVSSIAQTDAMRGSRGRMREFKITVTNLSYQQTMSPFFVMVHNRNAVPLYELGKPEKGNGLKLLAEDGMASDLVDHYTMMEKDGVFSAEGVGGPTPGGGSSSFNIKTSGSFEYLSIASMAIFTNDCFVGMAGVKLQDDMSYLVPGYDAGTEMNNELATHVPALGGTDGTDSGEGFVHVHRGINGGGDLTVLGYDWRNPMLHVEIERVH